MSHLVVSGVEIPDDQGRGRALKYPFQTMEVGSCIELFDAKELAAARNAAWREKKRNPSFNYTAISYGPDSKERPHTSTGHRLEHDERRVYGRLWRIEPEE